MESKQKKIEMRKRLDKTLAGHDLINKDSIKLLIKDQLLRSPFEGNEEDIMHIVEKRSLEVSNFVEMLRSAFGDEKNAGQAHGTTSHSEWKIKQDTDEVRVMYREGPHGTPFHTLLVEGYIDGPIDVCLCLAWESALYRKWWPQYNVPTFKITKCSCLQKVRIGEDISLVRMKVPWPVSEREALVHLFEIEFFKEDLVLVLINTISDTDSIDQRTHGFTNHGFPEAKDIVRIDMVGGCALQRVNSNRSYFRTIANMDIKLDFVPPWLINFISRQLIGNGYKLYQKAMLSVGITDKDYLKALKEPMYVRIRESLYSKNKPEIITGLETNTLKHERRTVTLETSLMSYNEKATVTEIVEEQPRQNQSSTKSQTTDAASVYLRSGEHSIVGEPSISPEVERALQILDRAIATVRRQGLPKKDDNFMSRSSAEATDLSQDGLLSLEPTRLSPERNHQFNKLSVVNQNERVYKRIVMQNGNNTIPVMQPTLTGGNVFDDSHEASTYAGSKQKQKRKSWKFGCLSPSIR